MIEVPSGSTNKICFSFLHTDTLTGGVGPESETTENFIWKTDKNKCST